MGAKDVALAPGAFEVVRGQEWRSRQAQALGFAGSNQGSGRTSGPTPRRVPQPAPPRQETRCCARVASNQAACRRRLAVKRIRRLDQTARSGRHGGVRTATMRAGRFPRAVKMQRPNSKGVRAWPIILSSSSGPCQQCFRRIPSLSPRWRPRPTTTSARTAALPDMILLHYTGMPSGEAALQRLRAPDSKVSAHYVVFENGRIVQCVPEERRAWHAGVSSWAGETDINSCSIGIEIVNPGHEFGYRDFPLRQVAAVISLCKSIITRRGPIPPDRVLAHSDVAPRAQAGSGREVSLGLAQRIRHRPLGAAGAARSRGPGAQAGRQRRQGDADAARAARLRLRHRGDRQL